MNQILFTSLFAVVAVYAYRYFSRVGVTPVRPLFVTVFNEAVIVITAAAGGAILHVGINFLFSL